MLHAERDEAEAGQRTRRPAREGWASVTVLDRAQAAGVEAFAFEPAAQVRLTPAAA